LVASTHKSSLTLQIKEIYNLAVQGKVSGADFVSGKTLIDKVHQKWGKPDKPIQAGDSYETIRWERVKEHLQWASEEVA
jgi:hypothetical protein